MEGCQWAALNRARIVRARIEYAAHSDYPAIKAEARTRGYRPAFLGEMMDSQADLYNWRGGVWAKA